MTVDEIGAGIREITADLHWLSSKDSGRAACHYELLRERSSIGKFLSGLLEDAGLDLTDPKIVLAVLRAVDAEAQPFPENPPGRFAITNVHRTLATGILIRLYDDREAEYPTKIGLRRQRVQEVFELGHRGTHQDRNGDDLFRGYLQFIETTLRDKDKYDRVVAAANRVLLPSPYLLADTAVLPTVLNTQPPSKREKSRPRSRPVHSTNLTVSVMVAVGTSLVAILAAALGTNRGMAGAWLFLAVAIVILVAIISSLSSVSRKRPIGVDPEKLGPYAARLATVSSDSWRHSQESLRVAETDHLIDIRCENADPYLSDSWENIRGQAGNNESIGLGGDLQNLVEIYTKIPSGRLVIIGERGAGKSAALTKFGLARPGEHKLGQPIPVLFTAATWPNRPIEDDAPPPRLLEWLEAELIESMAGLAQRTSSISTIAHDLLTKGHILPVIDGLDTLAPELFKALFDAINIESGDTGELSGLRYVLTCRSDVFEDAVSVSGILKGAAVIHVEPVSLDAAFEYLVASDSETWIPVRDLVQGPKAKAWFQSVLDVPLRVFIANAIYSRSEPDETGLRPDPMDLRKHADADDAREYLMSNFIPAVYRNSPHPIEDVQAWLEFLAKNTDGNRIAWWKLWEGISPLRRAIPFAVITTLLSGSCGLTLLWFSSANPILVALLFLFGLVAGSAIGVMPSPAVPMSIRFKNVAGWKESAASPLMTFSVIGVYWIIASASNISWWPLLASWIFAGVLPAATVFILRYNVAGSKSIWEEMQNTTAAALGGCFVIFLVGSMTDAAEGNLGSWLGIGVFFALFSGLAYVFGEPIPPAVLSSIRMADMLRVNLIFNTYFVLMFTIAYGFVFVPMLGWIPGVISGAAIGIVFGLFTNIWGRWIVFGRVWLPRTGNLPPDFKSFVSDACDRGVLYPDGPTFKFRHELVRERLAEQRGRRKKLFHIRLLRKVRPQPS
ncbi:hypothetical protein [Nocardia aurea]|uniref:NACHT domain-containing protein n=1 Tax=Nocardia aurea TaxID=2144174 RepID=A0ABV3FPP3_9NOCA